MLSPSWATTALTEPKVCWPSSMVLALLATVWEVGFRYEALDYRAVLNPAAARPLQVWSGGALVADEAQRAWRPWRLDVTDVDGNGRPDLAIGVLKPTRNLPFDHRTLFVYAFDGERLAKKWLGSSLGRPLVDFAFGPATASSPAPLFTLETDLDRTVVLNRYVWSGFGFGKRSEHGRWTAAADLRVARDGLRLTAEGRPLTLPIPNLP